MENVKKIDEILRVTVNSNKYTNKDTVNSNSKLVDKLSNFIREQSITPEGIALLLAELLNDKRSLPYYLLLVKEHNPSILLDIAHQTREKNQLGLIKTRMPIYFIGALKKIGFKTKFR